MHGVKEDLFWALIRPESGFYPGAVPPRGLWGLRQLLPGTAALLGVRDPFNLEQNIQGASRYLELCLARGDYEVGLALATYNAGPEKVAKSRAVPHFRRRASIWRQGCRIIPGRRNAGV